MRRTAATAAVLTGLAVAGCGGSSGPNACARYHQHVHADQHAAIAHGNKVAHNLAASLGQQPDPTLAKDTAQAYLDTALAHIKRPAGCQ